MTWCSDDRPGFDPATDLRMSVCPDADGGTRLTICGAIDLHTAPRLRAALAAAVREGAGTLVVDAAGLVFGGADLVGTLLHARAELGQRGRGLVVVNSPAFFRRVLAACQLEDLAG